MSRDTLYQQLRTQLAYLRLTAAAEALPAELDTATKTKATHAEFLHRLLGIEGAAVEPRPPPPPPGGGGPPRGPPAAMPGCCASPTSPPPGGSPTSTSPPNPPSTPP